MRSVVCAALLALVACGGPEPEAPAVLVAAAANLDKTIGRLIEDFEDESGVKAVVSLGSTATLTQQIENGAPFDVFLSADGEHVDKLIEAGHADASSRSTYARGRLALWAREGVELNLTGLESLLSPEVQYIAVANPKFAPYGAAALSALESADLKDQVISKVVYAQSASMAHQYAYSGNAEIAITALSLVSDGEGDWTQIDDSLHPPIEQTAAVLPAGRNADQGRLFVEYLLSERGQAILDEFGYERAD